MSQRAGPFEEWNSLPESERHALKEQYSRELRAYYENSAARLDHMSEETGEVSWLGNLLHPHVPKPISPDPNDWSRPEPGPTGSTLH